MKAWIFNLVRKIACWLGHHDYEADSVVVSKGVSVGALLCCFQCGAKKLSGFTQRDDLSRKQNQLVPITFREDL